MNVSILDALVQNFVSRLATGRGELFIAAMGVIAGLAAIELVMLGVQSSLNGQDPIGELIRKSMRIGFFIILIQRYEELIEMLLATATRIGELAGGSGVNTDTLLHPGEIANIGGTVVAPFFDSFAERSVVGQVTGVPLLIIGSIISILIVVVYFIIAIQVAFALVEFYFVATLGVLMIPWGVNKHTSWLAESAVRSLLAGTFRLSILLVIIGVSVPILETYVQLMGDEWNVSKLLSALLGGLTVMVMAMRGPAVVGQLMSGGSGALTAGAAMTAAVSSGTAGLSAAKTAGVAALGRAGAAIAAKGALSGGKAAGALGLGAAVLGAQRMKEMGSRFASSSKTVSGSSAGNGVPFGPQGSVAPSLSSAARGGSKNPSPGSGSKVVGSKTAGAAQGQKPGSHVEPGKERASEMTSESVSSAEQTEGAGTEATGIEASGPATGMESKELSSSVQSSTSEGTGSNKVSAGSPAAQTQGARSEASQLPATSSGATGRAPSTSTKPISSAGVGARGETGAPGGKTVSTQTHGTEGRGKTQTSKVVTGTNAQATNATAAMPPVPPSKMGTAEAASPASPPPMVSASRTTESAPRTDVMEARTTSQDTNGPGVPKEAAKPEREAKRSARQPESKKP